EYLLGPDGQPVPGQQVTIPHPTAGAGATTCRTLTQEEIDAGTPGFQCIGRTYFVNMPGEVKGIEAEIEAHPWDRFSFNASLGYADFSSPDLEVPTRANKRLTGIPEWTASAGVQYEWLTPGLNGSITPRLDAFYQGSIVYSAVSKTYNQNPYTVVNGRVTYLNDNGDISISVGVTNLFNKFYYRNFFIFQELGFPNVNAQPSPPREWFVTIRKNF
ncbi:MAG TPA: TonB-dependent receptor, partial [Steroidobacteraceae bacterium]